MIKNSSSETGGHADRLWMNVDQRANRSEVIRVAIRDLLKSELLTIVRRPEKE